jgi:hypothetical protein
MLAVTTEIENVREDTLRRIIIPDYIIIMIISYLSYPRHSQRRGLLKFKTLWKKTIHYRLNSPTTDLLLPAVYNIMQSFPIL